MVCNPRREELHHEDSSIGRTQNKELGMIEQCFASAVIQRLWREGGGAVVEPPGGKVMPLSDSADGLLQLDVQPTDRVDVSGRVSQAVPREQGTANDDDGVTRIASRQFVSDFSNERDDLVTRQRFLRRQRSPCLATSSTRRLSSHDQAVEEARATGACRASLAFRVVSNQAASLARYASSPAEAAAYRQPTSPPCPPRARP